MSGEVGIRTRAPGDDAWVVETLSSVWGTPVVVSRGRAHRADELPGLVAERDGDPAGLLTYHIASGHFEVVTLHAFEPRVGIGSALLRAARVRAREERCRRLWLVTTNDNAGAIAFYESFGMSLVAVHRGAVAESRHIKPGIPKLGSGGVPIDDELEFEFDLRDLQESQVG